MSTEDQKIKFDFVKNIPVISFCITLIGLLYLLLFYNRFHFDVFPYLTLSEIVTLSFKKLIYIVFFPILQIILFFYVRNYRTETKNYLLAYTTSLMILVYLFTNRASKYEYREIVNDGKYLGTRVILKDETIIFSDSSKSYIGQTSGYIFYYHFKAKEVQVIPQSEVKLLYIKRNN